GNVLFGPALAIYPATDRTGSAGKILIGGFAGVARYSVTGALDTTWASVSTPGALSLAIQPDGKVLAGSNGWQVAPLNADGTLDDSFGSGGVTGVAPLVSPSKEAGQAALLLEPNGDILQAGAGYVSNGTGGATNAFAVARYLPSEPEIGSFTANQVMAGGPVTLTASNISDDNPNSTISQVTFFYYDSSGHEIVVGTVTAPDSNGNWTVSASLLPGGYTLYAQATDSYGVLGDPLAYALTVQ
ncbi:MAG TPA: hypothetical protein VFA18_11215, partial [Gemmataceae bacterium]|nr:hypothetical protein [Gemmataceae bacterium]